MKRSHRLHRGSMSAAAMLIGTLAITVALFPARGMAQQQGVVAGRVVDADTGEPLPSATVLVRDLEIGALTDGSGQFMISGVPRGSRVVEARALGYRATTETVNVGGGTTTIDFSLEVRPIELGGIQVSVLRPDLQPQAELTDREVREANPKDSGQLLRNLDGVDAVRRGPLGLDPVVRGLRETEVGTYLDGTRLFPAGPARMDSPLTHLDPSAVSDIEVVKGPYALTWGAGNLSAVRVETAPLPARNDERAHGSLSVGYDSNLKASEVAGTASRRNGILSVWAAGAWREGSDYEPGGDSSQSIPGDFTSAEGRAKIGFDVGDNSLLTISGGYQDQGPIDYPGRLLRAKFFYASNFSARFETVRTAGLLRNVEVSAYLNDVSHAMDNSGKPTRNAVQPGMRTPPFGLDIRVDSDLEVWGGRAATDFVNGPWTIRLGADLYSANRNADRQIIRLTEEPPVGPPVGTVLFDNQLWPDATITDAGFFSRMGRTLDGGARLAGTLRVDYVSADADNASQEFLDYLQEVDGSQDLSQTEANLNAAVTAGFDLGSNWDLSLGLGSAVRTADATERYSDHMPATKAQTAAEFMGNPGLDPERSTQGDVWLEASYPRAAFQLNVFGRQVTDYITLEITEEAKRLPLPIFPEIVYRYVNGEATFFGGEASVSYALTDLLTTEVGGSYLWGEQTLYPDDPTVQVEEPAFGVAPFTGRYGLRYEDVGGRYFLEGMVKYVAKQDRVATTLNEMETDSYTTFDLRAGLAPVRGANLRVGVENLLDEEYVNHLNSRNPYSGMPIPEPGRVIYADVSYGF